MLTLGEMTSEFMIDGVLSKEAYLKWTRKAQINIRAKKIKMRPIIAEMERQLDEEEKNYANQETT